MKYKTELEFTEKLFKHMYLPIQYLTEPFEESPFPDNDLHRFIHPNKDLKEFKKNLPLLFESNTIYRIHDNSFCTYLFFKLPDTEKMTYACIGPYRLCDLSEQEYLEILENNSLSIEQLPNLKKFYEDLPFISDEQRILNIIYTLGEYMWDGDDNFSLKEVNPMLFEEILPLTFYQDTREFNETIDTMKHLEERYSIENQIMQAVSQGQSHKAELLLGNFSNRLMEKRSADPLRNLKNYCIILNTLLRKAAEAGAVHPLHIDSLSSRFAHKIETAVSLAQLTRLQSDMIHKYCLLVKNHSMKGYSLLVSKIITRIDSDLTADLSLRAQANLLNVNSSYLSTLFKKEVGMTLTDYVNNKRIEHAIFLLNTTTMQIQFIAQHCGIPDVNYFTKTFKKLIGKTPKEYRDSVMPYKKINKHEKDEK